MYNNAATKEPICCIELLTSVENVKGVTIRQKIGRLDDLFLQGFKDKRCVGKYNFLKGNYYRVLGNYDSAAFFTDQAMATFNATNDSIAIAETKNLSGTINLALNKYEKALTLFVDALNYGEHNTDSLWTAVVYINIGNIYFSREHYNKSLEYFQRTYNIYKNTDKTLMKIRVLNNLGTAYRKLGKIDIAEKHFSEALSNAENENNDFITSFILQNIGHLMVEKRDFEQAKSHLEMALPLAEAQNDTYGVAYCLLGIGMSYHGKKQYDLAQQKINSTVLLASEISANDLLKDAYKHLYKIDSASGKYDMALIHYQKFKALQDSAIWILKNKSTEEMLVKYEAKQRQKDNEILQAQNSLKDEKLTKQSYLMAFVIIILFIMAISFYQTRKVNRLLVKNAQTVELQKNKLEQQAKELHAGNKVTQEINANLEKIVESRTLKINQQNTALRNYEFENSHSVRGPLARILGLISLVDLSTMNDDQKVLVERIGESANELDEIIKNISKILGKA